MKEFLSKLALGFLVLGLIITMGMVMAWLFSILPIWIMLTVAILLLAFMIGELIS
jgi:hypothetical protein